MAKIAHRKYNMFQQALYTLAVLVVAVVSILAKVEAIQYAEAVLRVVCWGVGICLGAGVGSNAVKPMFENISVTLGGKKNEEEP